MRFLFYFHLLLNAFSTKSFAETIPQSYSFQRAPVVLKVGDQKILNLTGLKRFSVGSSHVRAITVPDAQDQLLVKAISPGITDLIVWLDHGIVERRQIRISESEVDNKDDPLLEALSHLNETEVIQAGKRTLLRGEIQTTAEAAHVNFLVSKFGEHIVNSTTVGSKLLGVTQQKLEEWVKTSKHSTQLWIEKIGQDLWVRGHVNTQAEQKTMEKQLKDIAPFCQFDVSSLPDQASTIYFKVFLLELRKNSFHSLGVSWPGSVQAGLRIASTGVQGLSELSATISALDQSGEAKILSNPELVVLAPGDAELFSGGEVPVQVTNQWDSHVEWKPYGLFLKLHVTHVVGAQVRLDIIAGVSHVEKISGEKLPEYFKNEMKQHIEARFGEPLFLSGLLKEDIRRSAQGIPLLRNIPILGTLFGSEDYLSNRSELVAILYPYSTPPKAPLEKGLPSFLPKEFRSISREWISPQEERLLRAAKDFPWNILESTNEDGVFIPKGSVF